MKKIILIIVLILLILIVMSGLYINLIYNHNCYSFLIEAEIPIFTNIEEKDTHGGFHGDGETLAKVKLSSEQGQEFIKEIKKNEHWEKLAIPEMLSNYMHNGLDKDVEIPNVNNGYWIFINRYHEVSDKYNYMEIFDKPSYNFSVAVFDTDTNILYIYSLDT